MSTTIDPVVLQQLVAQAVRQLQKEGPQAAAPAVPAVHDEYGVFTTMADAIEASAAAQHTLLFQSPSQRQQWIDVIRPDLPGQDQYADDVAHGPSKKQPLAVMKIKSSRIPLPPRYTPGIEDLKTDARTGEHGLVLFEYCPFGVIGAITPTTNPTETIINNSICMIAGGNTVVFSPHPRAKKTSIFLVQLLNKALYEAGAPLNLITMVREPSIEATDEMISNPKVRMVVATGGPGIVKKVLSSGKKAIGAGPGNPPVVVDETANIEKAAKDIVDGSSFDNNVPCIAEKEVFAVDSIFDYLRINMKGAGAYEITDADTIERLWKLVANEKGTGPKVEFVGKSAKYILHQIGIEVEDTKKLIIMEVAKDHPFVQTEMLMPILPLVRCDNVDQAIEWLMKRNTATATAP